MKEVLGGSKLSNVRPCSEEFTVQRFSFLFCEMDSCGGIGFISDLKLSPPGLMASDL